MKAIPGAVILTMIAAQGRAQTSGLPAARSEDVGLSASALASITPTLRAAFVDSGRIAGFVVAVARHGKLALFDSAGLMDREAGTPMRGSGVFRIASITKPITAVAVMQLVERGKLRLTDPVSRYIPRFADVKLAVDSGATRRLVDPVTPITIEHLLTITSGLSSGKDADAVADWAPTVEAYADSIAALPLSDQPGSVFNYFSGAYAVLARVVEIASGLRYDQYLEKNIFVPLRMRETAYHFSPAMEGRIPRIYSRATDGHLQTRPQLLGNEYRPESRWYSGGSGLLSTVHDYLRFAQMLLNGGELDGHRILQPSSVRRMMTGHTATGVFGPLGWIGDKYAWGYGGIVRDSSSSVARLWERSDDGTVVVRTDSTPAAPAAVGTYRWFGAYGTYFWIDRKTDLIGMMWAQASFGPDPVELERRFERLVYNAITRR